VGAGGIGCEVMKTMLLSGFTDFTIIDLDTIDVSNLNRQFLFNNTHVSKSKSLVAAEVSFNRFAHKDLEDGKQVSIKPFQGVIQGDDFDLDFFKSFTLVVNALDNRAARSYVNDMCLDADVPLIESGSQGYLGQVYPIIKGATRCFDCQGQQPENKTIASCTIRNTPSLPIHCIVWGKHLFAQLFGEPDADNDVSPDMDDPELKENTEPESNGSNTNGEEMTTNGIKTKESVRSWAESHEYNPELIFNKLFTEDILYLLSMENLWKSRRKPVPLDLNDTKSGIEPQVAGTSSSTLQQNGNRSAELTDQKLWSLKQCYDLFAASVTTLKGRLVSEEYLVWDKDDAPALDFVTAVSNLRSQCFSIERKSRFDVKQLAGNIIPAIPSTNSIVGGLIAFQAVAIIRSLIKTGVCSLRDSNLTPNERKDLFSNCREVWIKKIGTQKNLVAALELEPPNPVCQICPPTHKVEILLSFQHHSLVDLVYDILIPHVGVECPGIYVDADSKMLFSFVDFEEESKAEQELVRKKSLVDWAGVGKKSLRLRVVDEEQDDQTVKVVLKDVEIDATENNGNKFKLTVIAEPKKVDEEMETKEERSDSLKRMGSPVDIESPPKKVRV